MNGNVEKIPQEPPKITTGEYIREITESPQKHLLVEGENDRELFRRLKKALYPKDSGGVAIDSAERRLIGYKADDYGDMRGVSGNCLMVERFCETVAATPKANDFVAFVDREFRDFGHDDTLSDRTPNHYENGRLVWSRGHSAENYYFDFCIFKRSCEDLIFGDLVDGDVIDLFETVFFDAVRIGCTLSVAGSDHPSGRKHFNRMTAQLKWELLELTVGGAGERRKLTLDQESWGTHLLHEYRNDSGWAKQTKVQYNTWWPVVESADQNVVRWLCHGHIGLATIWAAFAKCVHESCHGSPKERKALAQTVLGRARRKKESTFRLIQDWVRHALQSNVESPTMVFKMLGLPPGDLPDAPG